MTKAFEEVADLIASGASREQVIGFQVGPEAKQRVEFLLRWEKLKGLTAEEARELDDYLFLEHLMRVVKSKARMRQEGE